MAVLLQSNPDFEEGQPYLDSTNFSDIYGKELWMLRDIFLLIHFFLEGKS